MSLNAIITGSNYWNPGDDFVRWGCQNVVGRVAGKPINWLFFNFAASRKTNAPCGEDLSVITSIKDIGSLAGKVDCIILPGLAAGRELEDFYEWVVQAGLSKKCYWIGAMFGNHGEGQPPASTVIKDGKIVLSRTRTIPDLPVARKWLHCPSTLASDHVVPLGEKIGVSVQLPDELGGICNHACKMEHHRVLMDAIHKLCEFNEVLVICHHKTEYYWWLRHPLLAHPNLDIFHSSFIADYPEAYSRVSITVSTRLHCCLYGVSLGRPGIIVNDTPRHTGALEEIPWVTPLFDAAAIVELVQSPHAGDIQHWKGQLMDDYVDALKLM